MIFSLVILGHPTSTESVNTAFRFASAVLASGHKLYRIFFYHDGVYCANQLVTPAQDDLATADWASLACDHNIDLVVCIASALKRGVINEDEASRYDKPAANMSPAYHLSGLGQLLDAILESDRVISFGP